MHILQAEFATPLYDEMIRLRDRILREPLGLEFTVKDLSSEYKDIHLGCYDDQAQLLGCCVLVDQENGELKMRQVAVDIPFQKKGVGKLLVEATEKYGQLNKFNKVVLNARKTAVPFYTKLAYKKNGKEFEEVGISHFKMEKEL